MDENIFGCFMQVGFDPNLEPQDFQNLADAFSPYIWGEKGISSFLKLLNYQDYGKDLKLVLFQFIVCPTKLELERLKEIENYRKNEKSIGIPIVITQENFFSKTESNRYDFLKQSIIKKMYFLEQVIVKRKLDTKISLLELELKKVLEKIIN